MSHLSIETLARLVDETPDNNEATHLQLCLSCRSELEGMKADAFALGALPDLEPSLAQWYAVERKLAQEGLLRGSVRREYMTWLRPALQIAAALAIFVLGNYTAPLLGRASSPVGVPVAAAAAPAGYPAVVQAPAPNNALAGLSRPAASTTAPATRGDAANVVREAERAYLNALTQYAEVARQTESADPVARLAALESIVLTTRAALGQAPADPVINGYHLTALAQRDATIKQMAATAGKTWF